MATGFNPFKKLWGNIGPGGSGLLGGRAGPRSVSATQAASHARQPWRTVTMETMTSQPYPDRILKHQAAKNLGWNPDWHFDPRLSDAENMRAMRANEALSPTGYGAAQQAKDLAGKPEDFETMTSELDSGWVQDAIASAMPGEPTLPAAPTRGGTTGQPRPGDFSTIVPEPSPFRKKKRRLEEIGLLA